MLTLVGLGLWDEKDLTLRGIEVAKTADKVYIELYTNIWHGKDDLEKIIDRKIEELKREDLEQNLFKIIDESKNRKIVIFVPGDPLVATTHSVLIEEAKKAGIETKVIHNASIISAVGEIGLHIYKFGATATVPFREKTGGKLPESVYDTIKMNKNNSLHTLLLLDIAKKRCMTANEAMKTLLAIEEEKMEGIFTNDTEIVVFARVGSDNQLIKFGKVGELKDIDFGEPPMVLIIPGNMHFTEREYLNNFR